MAQRRLSCLWITASVLVLCLCVTHGHTPAPPVDTRHHTDSYARLFISRYNMAVLIDTAHNYLNVRSDRAHACYLINLAISPRTAMSLMFHLSTTGGEILRKEFVVDREIPHGELVSVLSNNHGAFCGSYRVFNLIPAPGVTQAHVTTRQPDSAGAESALVG